MNENEIVKNVLRSDRRKMWIWGILCVLAWALAVMLPWSMLLPMMAKVAEHLSQQHVKPEESAEMLELLRAIKIGTMGTMLGNLVTMLAAAGCTIAFRWPRTA